MLATTVILAVFLGLLVLSFLAWAACLRFGLRWAKVPGVTVRRVVLATLGATAAQLALSVLFRLPKPTTQTVALFLGLLELGLMLSATWLVIARVFQARFVRAIQAWLPTLLPQVLTILVAWFVLRPLVCEAFVIPTNSMAPTLLGTHWSSTCPECGEANFCTPSDPRFRSREPRWMICENFHIREAETSLLDQRVFSGDRILAAKFLAPQRWDLIVFRYPEDPATMFVKRLVGLPGETIHIEDGAVWADGRKLTPPDALRGIEYVTEFPDLYQIELWGTKDRPAVLEDDEYFVLGDFSRGAKDSRFWVQGAPGHHPYAVPESYLHGVVTHIYWPPVRWRILR